MSFARYPAYKDSGVDWLGEVPAHWEVQRLKRSAQLLTEKTDRRTNPVALENIESWSGRFVPTDTEFAGDGVAFQHGDILFGKLRPYLAKALLAQNEGEAVGDFHVMRPQEGAIPRFLQYQLLEQAFIDIVDGSTFGSKMPRASWEFVGTMPLPAPPPSEQTAIATFLDRETAKIDALVAEQERLIALLKEKRQAVISHAVTKGLDPSVPMKDSGVEWLGEVPAHWEVVRIKHVVASIEQGWSPQCESYPVESADQWGVLKVGCVNGGVFNPDENKVLPDDLTPVPALAIRAGDVLVSRANTRELVGSAATALMDYPNLLLCDKLYRLRLNHKMNAPQYLAYFLGCLPVREQIELAATGASSSMLNIGQATILELRLPHPDVEEQLAITAHLDAVTARMRDTATEAEAIIAALQERRSALISAAVTGQIDVRRAPEQAP